MRRPDPSVLIQDLIREKETEQKLEGELLNIHFHETYESLKPINILKETVKKVINSPGIKSTVVNSIMGLASGFLVKRIFVGSSLSPIKKLSGAILEMVIASKVTNNAEEIKDIASIMIKKMVKHNVDLEKDVR